MYVDDAGWGALDVLEWCKYASGIHIGRVRTIYTYTITISSMSNIYI